MNTAEKTAMVPMSFCHGLNLNYTKVVLHWWHTTSLMKFMIWVFQLRSICSELTVTCKLDGTDLQTKPTARKKQRRQLIGVIGLCRCAELVDGICLASWISSRSNFDFWLVFVHVWVEQLLPLRTIDRNRSVNGRASTTRCRWRGMPTSSRGRGREPQQ